MSTRSRRSEFETNHFWSGEKPIWYGSSTSLMRRWTWPDDRVQEDQFVADRAGDDHRLVVRRGHQVVRLLADGEGGHLSAPVAWSSSWTVASRELRTTTTLARA
jgi:hypothetical protein